MILGNIPLFYATQYAPGIAVAIIEIDEMVSTQLNLKG
jgi:hypothetical protein